MTDFGVSKVLHDLSDEEKEKVKNLLKMKWELKLKVIY